MRIAVIGAGIAAHTFVTQALKEIDYADFVVYGDEDRPPYYRPRVLETLVGTATPDSLVAKPLISDKRCLFTGLAADHFDPDSKVVWASDGSASDYDILVLANGASAFRLPLPGGKSDGIFTVRNFDDAGAIGKWAKAHPEKPVVIGGGLLGIEAAATIAAYTGSGVTIMESAERLLPRQLDEAASAHLAKLLSAKGLKILTGASTSNFLSKDGRVTGVKCDDGFLVDASMVVESVGIRPNTFMAVQAGLKVSRGVVVDDSLMTSAEDVYAIGDVAEHRGRVAGTMSPAMDMARTLSKIIAGTASSYAPAPDSAVLKAAGVDVVSLGDVSTQSEVFEKASGDAQERFHVKDGALVGATLVGTKERLVQAKTALGKPFDKAAFGF